MTISLSKKSSFTLPVSEIKLVLKLKKMLNLKSNTQVIRTALHELNDKLNRNKMRSEFEQASLLVQKHNAKDMEELDQLNSEGLE